MLEVPKPDFKSTGPTCIYNECKVNDDTSCPQGQECEAVNGDKFPGFCLFDKKQSSSG